MVLVTAAAEEISWKGSTKSGAIADTVLSNAIPTVCAPASPLDMEVAVISSCVKGNAC